ncbi:MAG: ATP-dependent metallopeptidase FtsH/Yme1/Tma family protein, partial [Reyranella sp.]|nr:ATP-dependent metallopeptidase FtsH/Yme1/Tma family protein [Reyranella sp.]
MIMALVVIAVVRDFWLQQQKVDHIPYSEFRALLDAGRVSEVAVGETSIRGTLANPAAGEKPVFITEKLQPDIADFLANYKIKYKAEPDSGWLKAILSWVVPTAIFVGVWIF